jgi:hypothetical protein
MVIRPVPPPLAKPAMPVVSEDKTPSLVVAPTEAPMADLPSEKAPPPRIHEDPDRNPGYVIIAPGDAPRIANADSTFHPQFEVTQGPDSHITSNLCSPAAPPQIERGEVKLGVLPSATESHHAPPSSRATENPDRVGPQSRPEVINPPLGHPSPSLPELTYCVPELLIEAAEEAARSGRFEMLREPRQVAYFLASINWPLAGKGTASHENELVLRHGSDPIHLRLDETLFVIQLALARGLMQAYPTWNFELQPILGRDQECQIQSGPGRFLNPFHNDLFDLEKKLKDPLFAAAWMFRSRKLDFTKPPLEIAAEFCRKYVRNQHKLAVLLTAIHYRTHKNGYLNFDHYLRRNCYDRPPWPSYITRFALQLPV